jgi:hypothetical protein
VTETTTRRKKMHFFPAAILDKLCPHAAHEDRLDAHMSEVV